VWRMITAVVKLALCGGGGAMKGASLLLAVSLIFATPRRAETQTVRTSRIAVLLNPSEALAAPSLTAFRQGLQELGYVEGKNVAIVSRSAEGKLERLPILARELIETKPDVVVVAGPQAIRAVKEASGMLPVVMAIISDPVAEQLVESLAHPGGSITGIAFQNAELTAKRLELLKRVLPTATRIVALADPTLGRSGGLQELQAAARSLGMELQIVEVRGPDEFDRAFRAARRARAQGLVVLASPLLNAHRKSLIDHAARNRLPATYEMRSFVADGGLMSYGPNFEDMYRRSARYVDKILRGVSPADLPIEQASRFEFVVNLKTATALGLTIPASVLQQADQVIE
jgi:putative tryptophan/tyrosine transport system substrate-binding protein